MQFQICNSGEVWTSVSRAEARRIAHKRTGALAAMIRHARKAQKQEAREYRRAERELQAELREADRRNRALWKRIRVKPELKPKAAIERKPQAHRPTRSCWLAGASQLPRYSGQIFDRMGRAGIFFRVRYYGHSTKAGVGRRSTLYIWAGAHETDDGRIMFASNVGENAEEAVAALEAVELFNREAQAGAKLLFHAIANVPYQLFEMHDGIERMFEIGQRFAEEQFGSRDLPFALALHPPSEEGDQRNWHLHIIFSTRPLVRTGDHEWDIGRMMRREIDSPDAFEEMRHLYAHVQTEVAQEAGFNITYTALSNAERGLPNAPQKHLGSARTARVRRGEMDQVNESNWETVLAGEAGLLDEQLRHAQERAMADQALLDRVQDRAAPIIAAATNGPGLGIAALDHHVGSIANLSSSGTALDIDHPAEAPVLAIANLQPRDRVIADVVSLRQLQLFEHGGARGTSLSRSATRGTEWSIGVPRAPSGIITDEVPPPPVPSLPVVRARGHQIAATPMLAMESARIVSSALSLGGARVIAGETKTSSAMSPSWAAMRAAAPEISLSLGRDDNPPKCSSDVAKIAAVLAGAVSDREMNDLDRLFAEQRARVEAQRERTRRNRVAKERAEIERARKAEAERREREDAERQHEAEIFARVEQEQQAAPADTKPVEEGAEIPASRADTREARLAALRDRDDWVADGEDGLSVTEEARRAAGLTVAEMRSEPGQRVLRVVADSQMKRLEPVLDDIASPPAVRAEHGDPVLDERFDPALRTDFHRWAASPDFRSFAVTVWPRLAVGGISSGPARDRGEPLRPVAQEAVAPLPTTERRRMLAQAAGLRETLMSGWDAIRPLITPPSAEPRERAFAPEAERQPGPQRPASRSAIDPRGIDR